MKVYRSYLKMLLSIGSRHYFKLTICQFIEIYLLQLLVISSEFHGIFNLIQSRFYEHFFDPFFK